MTSVPDFANANKVFYRLISKGTGDHPVFGQHHKGSPNSTKKPGFIAAQLAKGAIPLDAGPGWAVNGHPELSVKAEAGVNLYLIGLEPGTQTRFGPGRYPIQLLPLDYTDMFLKDVGLIYADGAGTAQFVAAADIPANYGAIPASAMLAFTLDRTALENAWKLGVSNAGHTDYVLKVPFFLNLYDCVSGRPVWAYGEPDVVTSTGSGAAQLKTAKPGKSAAKAAQSGGNPGLMTHGGIHPGSPTQQLY